MILYFVGAVINYGAWAFLVFRGVRHRLAFLYPLPYTFFFFENFKPDHVSSIAQIL